VLCLMPLPAFCMRRCQRASTQGFFRLLILITTKRWPPAYCLGNHHFSVVVWPPLQTFRQLTALCIRVSNLDQLAGSLPAAELAAALAGLHVSSDSTACDHCTMSSTQQQPRSQLFHCMHSSSMS
jgi:hypothetical protein